MSLPIKKNCIFVSIASYRDDVCSTTLMSLYTMADTPANVYVGICQQNKKEDMDCVENNIINNLAPFKSQIRIIRISEYEAKGPTWARYLCSTLWGGEEFYMQVDSHTRFVQGWDTKCIKMINLIKNMGLSNKPVISHYPKDYDEHKTYSDENKNDVPRMCKAFFNNQGMISFMGSSIMKSSNIPYETPYMASGLFFCEAYFLNELPYDPNLPYLFVGEEILHSIRFYTFGWNIFTPTENVVFHEYTRAEKPKVWTDNVYSDEKAFKKVKKYLKLIDESTTLDGDVAINMHKYGLGTVRSLQDYYDFAGIDIKNKKVTTNFCNEGNKATEEDIRMSNEVNHVKENFDISNINFQILLFSITVAILVIVTGVLKQK